MEQEYLALAIKECKVEAEDPELARIYYFPSSEELSWKQRYIRTLAYYNRVTEGSQAYLAPETCLILAIQQQDLGLVRYFDLLVSDMPELYRLISNYGVLEFAIKSDYTFYISDFNTKDYLLYYNKAKVRFCSTMIKRVYESVDEFLEKGTEIPKTKLEDLIWIVIFLDRYDLLEQFSNQYINVISKYLFIHELEKGNIAEAQNVWSSTVGLPEVIESLVKIENKVENVLDLVRYLLKHSDIYEITKCLDKLAPNSDITDLLIDKLSSTHALEAINKSSRSGKLCPYIFHKLLAKVDKVPNWTSNYTWYNDLINSY